MREIAAQKRVLIFVLFDYDEASGL